MWLVLTDARIDLVRRVATLAGEDRTLSKLEVELLGYLVARRGTNVSRGQLLAQVWGYKDGIQTRAVDAALFKLRSKIELDARNPKHLFAVRGVGYRYEGPPLVDTPGGVAGDPPARNEAPTLLSIFSALPGGADVATCAAVWDVPESRALELLRESVVDGWLTEGATGRPSAVSRWIATVPTGDPPQDELSRLDRHWLGLCTPRSLRDIAEQADGARGFSHRGHDIEAVCLAVDRAWARGADEEAVTLTLLQAELCLPNGPWDVAAAALAAAADSGAAHDLRSALDVARARVLLAQGKAVEADRVLAQGASPNDPDVLVEHLLVRAAAVARAPARVEALGDLLEEAARAAIASGDAYLNGRVALRLALHAWAGGEVARAEATFEEARRLLSAVDAPAATAIVDTNLGITKSWRGDVDEAQPALERGLDFYETRGNQAMANGVRLQLALNVFLRGDTRRALAELALVTDSARRLGDARLQGLSAMRRAQLLTLSGDAPRAVPKARAAIALLAGAQDARSLALARGVLAFVLEVAGRPAPATAEETPLDPYARLELSLLSTLPGRRADHLAELDLEARRLLAGPGSWFQVQRDFIATRTT